MPFALPTQYSDSDDRSDYESNESNYSTDVSESTNSTDTDSDKEEESNRSQSVVSVPTSTPRHGAKEWFLPHNEDRFETFIDHGSILDKDGYPIYPNGRTVFVKVPSSKILNFGTVGYTKRTCSETPKDGEWKVTCIYCLGVLVCDQRSPGAKAKQVPAQERFTTKHVPEQWHTLMLILEPV
ncbi:uncharacterized protein PGTG_17918 [Puccinia graminis f. sp. tritici CRL 75-36-700-3]|uniref:Uncharacterized protein n=1 Tax=Puccinia graminis f. sp. tritici (strain CRL 75-36-700-3 / race SCCL) TaxID=418459 RepID=E3L5R6_PUCGT|nr:uncharacterized protein PGTG_17918 [Puccinia graminis f. sp. tritici CRL 75-36-700-3]EFP91891.1 hypothetical protein PGTG_17918 [Puccinia graminis f. sp. tritici CRL 75-36-700-3]